MGNQQSSSRSSTPTHHNHNHSTPASAPAPASNASHAHKERPSHPSIPDIQHQHHHAHAAKRRASIPVLTVKALAAPPSASFETAESSHHPTPIRPLSRGPSQKVATGTTLITNNLLAAADVRPPSTTSHDTMGNEQSKGQGQGRQKHGPPQPILFQPSPSTPQQSPPEPAAAPALSTQTSPVDVPAIPREDAPSSSRTDDPASSINPASASQHEYMPVSHFDRPPRLPLPIEEEHYQPGSPILSSPIDHDDIDGNLPRHNMSMLSSTTADDEDLGDEFKGPGTGRPTVPTLIEWEGPEERVYVTGTFAGWNRKYKLHKNGPSEKKDVLSAYIHITPGTHHLTFLVENEMCTSKNMPTAVDYTNILVNYIEVSPDDVLKPAPSSAQASSSDKGKQKADADATPVQDREKPTGIHPPQVMPRTPEMKPAKADLPQTTAPEPDKRYHQLIPRFLSDLDAHEDSSKCARANAMTSNLPTPPTLPGFLGKSILNGQTPHKDDSSVLIMPNHTVLNHLATSSIKDNILATSATTRYKHKFLTTIMYKPKEEHGETY